jgi:hypothetical protein
MAKIIRECKILEKINQEHYKRVFNAETRPSLTGLGEMSRFIKS